MADMVKWLTQTAVNRSYMGSIPIIRPIEKKVWCFGTRFFVNFYLFHPLLLLGYFPIEEGTR